MLIEGVGADWIVVRRPDRQPEIIHFKTLDELIRGLHRHLPPPVVASAGSPTPVSVSTPAVTRLPVIDAPSAPIAQPRPLPAKPLPPGTDCRTCGACCAPSDPRSSVHVRLEEADLAQIPGIMRKSLVAADGAALVTKSMNGQAVCSALNGMVGGQCKCGIYNQRPLVCRLFEIGSVECLEARQRFGL